MSDNPTCATLGRWVRHFEVTQGTSVQPNPGYYGKLSISQIRCYVQAEFLRFSFLELPNRAG